MLLATPMTTDERFDDFQKMKEKLRRSFADWRMAPFDDKNIDSIDFNYFFAPPGESPDQTRPDQTRPDQTRPDQTRPDQTRVDQGRPG